MYAIPNYNRRVIFLSAQQSVGDALIVTASPQSRASLLYNMYIYYIKPLCKYTTNFSFHNLFIPKNSRPAIRKQVCRLATNVLSYTFCEDRRCFHLNKTIVLRVELRVKLNKQNKIN